MPYGIAAEDYGGVLNFERLTRERREKASKALQKYNLDAVLCFAPENCRYLTVGPSYPFYRYVLFPVQTGEPILHEAGMIELAIRKGIEGINSKRSIPLPPGLLPSNIPAFQNQMKKFVQQIKEELTALNLLNGAIGIDTRDQMLLDALKEAGVKHVSIDGGAALNEARTIKTRDEVELLRMGCVIVEGCFQRAREVIRPGITEQQIWAEISKTAFDLGAEALLGGHVSSGPHSFPIANTISSRILRPGDIVLIDVYDLSFHGYRTCYYRNFSVGTPTKAQKDAWIRARDWTWEAIDLLKPGCSTRELVEKWPKAQEFGYDDEDAGALCQWGHGLGLTLYETPMISRIWSIDYPEEIKEGMVFAVETLAPTGETSADYPNGQCLRIEEEVHITKDGYDLLTKWPIDEIIECW